MDDKARNQDRLEIDQLKSKLTDFGPMMAIPRKTMTSFVDVNQLNTLDTFRTLATISLTITATYWSLMLPIPAFNHWLGYVVGGVFSLTTLHFWRIVHLRKNSLQENLIYVPADKFYEAIKPYADSPVDE